MRKIYSVWAKWPKPGIYIRTCSAKMYLKHKTDMRQHRRCRSSVNCRGHAIFAWKYVWKINKMTEFYMILARKIIKIPEFLWYLTEKLTKFSHFTRFLPENARILHNNWPKKFFSDFFFWGGEWHVPSLPPSPVTPSPTPMCARH